MIDYKYAYLIGDLFVGLFWLGLYIARKDLHKELWVTSVVFGLCGPLTAVLFLRDYWRPQLFLGPSIGIEDFLFGFFIGGIAGVFYKELFHKHLSRRHDRSHRWIWFVPSFVILGVTILSVTILYFDINSVYASIFMFGIVTLIILFYRHDLLLESVTSGLLVSLLMALFYVVFLKIFPELFSRWWLLSNLSGLFIFQIPVEELWWAFSFGIMVGPLYEFFSGRKLVNNKRVT